MLSGLSERANQHSTYQGAMSFWYDIKLGLHP